MIFVYRYTIRLINSIKLDYIYTKCNWEFQLFLPSKIFNLFRGICPLSADLEKDAAECSSSGEYQPILFSAALCAAIVYGIVSIMFLQSRVDVPLTVICFEHSEYKRFVSVPSGRHVIKLNKARE